MPHYHFRKFLNQIPTLRNSIVLPQMCRSFVTREFFQFFSIFFKQYPADFHWQNQYLLHQDGYHIKNRRLVVYNGATPLFSLKYTNINKETNILLKDITFNNHKFIYFLRYKEFVSHENAHFTSNSSRAMIHCITPSIT